MIKLSRDTLIYCKKNRTLWHASVDLREQLDLKVHNNDLILYSSDIVKFMFSKKATKIDQIFIVNLTFTK